MALKFFKFVPTSLVSIDKTVLKGIDNPGAIVTIEGRMVVHPENKTLQLSEIEVITELLIKTK